MRAISMKCTQEQFESIKPKLKGLKDCSDNNFQNYPYLTSPKDKNHWVNNHNKNTMDKTREVFETWDEKVFLEACGIEVKPSIEEVKEYFKNAKEVKSIHTSWTGDVMIETIRYDFNDSNFIVCDSSHVCGITTLWSLKKGYAKIISYKDPKFEITKEIVLKYQMKDEFPECFDVKLEAGKWYGHTRGGFTFIKKINGDQITSCGFYNNMEWYDKEVWKLSILKNGILIDAVDKEVQQALEKEAVKRGFKEGVYIKSLKRNGTVRICENVTELRDTNCLYMGGCCIMKDGIWAAIIPQYTQQEAEEKFNFKIIVR